MPLLVTAAATLVSLALPASTRPLGHPAAARALDVELLRPIPGPVVPVAPYRQAVAAATRGADGAPGPSYWQVHSRYDIEARLKPRAARVSGSEKVRFLNRSPDDLPYLMLHLHQNVHAEGAVRNSPAEVTAGVTLQRVAVDGTELFEVPWAASRGDGAGERRGEDEDPAVGYAVEGTVLRIRPPAPVAAGGEAELELDWSFPVPRSGMGRMGHSDREIFFIAYWFPKIGVYDDLRGWDVEPYLGRAEFYDSYADYRVSLTVPAGWTVAATGELLNPEEVLSAQTRERLAAARQGAEVVTIATPEDRRQGRVTAHPRSGALTYRFAATDVRDFTWTASDVQAWDATSAVVPDRDGDGEDERVAIHSFWRPGRAPLWASQARYARHSIEFLSRETGLPYPWPHMTSVEGADIIGGGMEFPMLTLIGSYQQRGAPRLYGVTVHELAHMWTPMILGSNEKRHAWMDEGFATYLANRGIMDFFAPERGERESSGAAGESAGEPVEAVGGRRQGFAPQRREAAEAEEYLKVAGTEREGRIMQHGDHYEAGYGVASYAKPATLLVTLRHLLGREVFDAALDAYFHEWAFKHPAPWDLFRTFERAAGADLDWFWSSWYHETWTLDQAVAGVTQEPGGPVVTVEDRGFVPMPARVAIETTGAGTLERTVPVGHWLGGATTYEIELPASVGEVRRVRIDPDELFPDADRGNNVWPAPTAVLEGHPAAAPGSLAPRRQR